MTEPRRSCQDCAAPLIGSRADARFCSGACRARTHRRLQAQEIALAAFRTAGLRPLNTSAKDPDMKRVSQLVDLPALVKDFAPGQSLGEVVYADHEHRSVTVITSADVTDSGGVIGWQD